MKKQPVNSGIIPPRPITTENPYQHRYSGNLFINTINTEKLDAFVNKHRLSCRGNSMSYNLFLRPLPSMGFTCMIQCDVCLELGNITNIDSF